MDFLNNYKRYLAIVSVGAAITAVGPWSGLIIKEKDD
jgi:hypothetical protein